MIDDEQEVEVREINNIVAARSRSSDIFMVLVSYAETDAMNSVGLVLRDVRDRDGDFDTILNTNDSITYLWQSPEGSLWVASARGNVWTTADVNWPEPDLPWLDYTVEDPSFEWHIAQLPWLRELRRPPIPESIWGTSDQDVHVTTFQGSIYHWDGSRWEERIPGPTQALHDIHGRAPDEAYAVGEEGTILRYDGTGWNPIPFPDDAGDGEALTGVRVIAPNEVYICSRSGWILRGGRDGFEVVTQARAALYGIGHFRGRLLLAAGDAGVLELQGNRVRVVKDTFAAVGVFEEEDIVFFVEPNQEPDSRLIEFSPAEPDPWWGRTYPG